MRPPAQEEEQLPSLAKKLLPFSTCPSLDLQHIQLEVKAKLNMTEIILEQARE